MKISFSTLVLIGMILEPSSRVLAGVYSGSIDDSAFNSLSSRVETAYQHLVDKIAEAESAGVSTQYAETTRITVELFKDVYVPWDRANPSSHHTAWKERFDPLYRNCNNTAGVAVPFDELDDCLEIMDVAMAELQDQIDGDIVLRDVPDFANGTYTLNKNYYELDGKKVIPFKIFWQQSDEDYYQAYGRMGGTYYGFIPNMLSPNSVNATRLESFTGTMEDLATRNINPIEFWHGTVVSQGQWPRTDYPEMFEAGGRFFNHYDIDHPMTRVWENYLFENVLEPLVAPLVEGGGLRSHLLNNEPRFPIRQGNSDAANSVSDYTFSKYATWLEDKYRNVGELNRVYNRSYSDFSEAATANYVVGDGVSESLQGGPIWYDWCRFNQWRVNDWFVFLNEGVHSADPTGHTHIKIWGGGGIHRDYQDQGIDYEFLTNLVSISGSDNQFIPLNIEFDTIISWSKDWRSRYMFDWRQQGVMMDFIKSIAPDKPYKDSEWHGVDSTRWLSFHNTEEYLRPALWLAACHGLSGMNTWFLNRNMDGSIRQVDLGVNGTFAVQPIMMNAYGRVMKEINAHAEVFAGLVPRFRHYVIYYSMDSAIQDRTYSDQMTDVYEALKLLNVPVGFTTPSMLANVNDPAQTVIVPRSEFVSDVDLAALKAFADAGGSIVLVDADRSFSKDELGGERDAENGIRSFAQVDYDHDTFVMARTFEVILAERRPEFPISVDISTIDGGAAYGVFAQQSSEASNDENVVLLINASQSARVVELELNSGGTAEFVDLINGQRHANNFVMQPQEVALLRKNSNERWLEFIKNHQLSGVKSDDFDSDGRTDWAEYVFGGDPTNPTTLGGRPDVDLERNVVRVEIRNDSDLEVDLESTFELSDAEWITMETLEIDENDGLMKIHEFSITLPEKRVYFRGVGREREVVGE